VVGSVLARQVYGKEIPVVSGAPRSLYTQIKSGTRVFIDADRGAVEVRG
jgi:predicted aconitase with swiveling domain